MTMAGPRARGDERRARLTETLDTDEAGREASGAEGKEAILAAVAVWLHAPGSGDAAVTLSR